MIQVALPGFWRFLTLGALAFPVLDLISRTYQSYAAETIAPTHMCLLLLTQTCPGCRMCNRTRLLVSTHVTRWATQPALSHGLPTSLTSTEASAQIWFFGDAFAPAEDHDARAFEGFRGSASCGHPCSGHPSYGVMNVTMVWARTLWSSYGVEHECYYGLGMDALVIIWGRT